MVRQRQRDSNLSSVLAAVVPAENGQNNAEAFLRGVADSQFSCNAKNRYPIEIKIANDADEQGRAKIIAEELSNNKEIVGIIGHFSSSTTAKGLKAYEKKKILIWF